MGCCIFLRSIFFIGTNQNVHTSVNVDRISVTSDIYFKSQKGG